MRRASADEIDSRDVAMAAEIIQARYSVAQDSPGYSAMIRYSADVIVIGAGIAGVTAAVELLARGRSVLLIDRDAEANMGGLAKESFGGIWFAGTNLQRRYGIHDGAQQGLEDWHAFAEFGPEDHWPRAWAAAYVQRSVAEIYDWLRNLGVEFMPMPLWVERGLHTPGNSVPRWHIVWGTGHELAVVLNRHLLSRPNVERLQQRYDHRVEALVATNGRVTGCRGTLEGSGQEFEASAESVIVASGGINGDLARVKANWHADWGRPPETILNGSHKYADGRLHDAAAAARRQRDAPRLAMELCGGRASLAAAQARPRPVAGAAEVGVVARLARRAHRADAARDRVRHARPRRADLPAAARVFVAAAESHHHAQGTRHLGRRIQPGVPRARSACTSRATCCSAITGSTTR